MDGELSVGITTKSSNFTTNKMASLDNGKHDIVKKKYQAKAKQPKNSTDVKQKIFVQFPLRIPCQASRGVDPDPTQLRYLDTMNSIPHTPENAYFDLKSMPRHGEVLTCSHPICGALERKKSKFAWCIYCQKPYAKRNFKIRHSHNDSNTTVFCRPVSNTAKVSDDGEVDYDYVKPGQTRGGVISRWTSNLPDPSFASSPPPKSSSGGVLSIEPLTTSVSMNPSLPPASRIFHHQRELRKYAPLMYDITAQFIYSYPSQLSRVSNEASPKDHNNHHFFSTNEYIVDPNSRYGHCLNFDPSSVVPGSGESTGGGDLLVFGGVGVSIDLESANNCLPIFYNDARSLATKHGMVRHTADGSYYDASKNYSDYEIQASTIMKKLKVRFDK